MWVKQKLLLCFKPYGINTFLHAVDLCLVKQKYSHTYCEFVYKDCMYAQFLHVCTPPCSESIYNNNNNNTFLIPWGSSCGQTAAFEGLVQGHCDMWLPGIEALTNWLIRDQSYQLKLSDGYSYFCSLLAGFSNYF